MFLRKFVELLSRPLLYKGRFSNNFEFSGFKPRKKRHLCLNGNIFEFWFRLLLTFVKASFLLSSIYIIPETRELSNTRNFKLKDKFDFVAEIEDVIVSVSIIRRQWREKLLIIVKFWQTAFLWWEIILSDCSVGPILQSTLSRKVFPNFVARGNCLFYGNF